MGLFSNHAELEDPKINMTVKIHQTKFLNELKILKETLPASSFDIWSYKVSMTFCQNEKDFVKFAFLMEYFHVDNLPL